MTTVRGGVCAMAPEQAMVLVPRVPTKAMLEAATNAMRKRQEEMGEDWFPVSNKVKACIRWEAMLAAWEAMS